MASFTVTSSRQGRACSAWHGTPGGIQLEHTEDEDGPYRAAGYRSADSSGADRWRHKPGIACGRLECRRAGHARTQLAKPRRSSASIRATRELTDRAFGVNLILEWSQAERLQACLEESVELVSLFWGDPAPHVEAVHAAGARVAHTLASAEEALSAVEAGVDVIIAQGWEAAGHVWGDDVFAATLGRRRRLSIDFGRRRGHRGRPGASATLALGAAGRGSARDFSWPKRWRSLPRTTMR